MKTTVQMRVAEWTGDDEWTDVEVSLWDQRVGETDIDLMKCGLADDAGDFALALANSDGESCQAFVDDGMDVEVKHNGEVYWFHAYGDWSLIAICDKKEPDD